MSCSAQDLPLMSNTKSLLIRHYYYDWDVSFENEVIRGSVYLFPDFAFCHHCDSRVFSCQDYIQKKERSCSVCENEEVNINDLYINNEESKAKEICLDCYDLNVVSVSSLSLERDTVKQITNDWDSPLFSFKDKLSELVSSSSERKPLSFKLEKWVLRISYCDSSPLQVVSVSYETKINNSSLRWATDQDGRFV